MDGASSIWQIDKPCCLRVLTPIYHRHYLGRSKDAVNGTESQILAGA